MKKFQPEREIVLFLRAGALLLALTAAATSGLRLHSRGGPVRWNIIGFSEPANSNGGRSAGRLEERKRGLDFFVASFRTAQNSK